MDTCPTQNTIHTPQFLDKRCRVCYQTTYPLLSLCQCSGSIGYVHEDCIMDWITRKMQQSPHNVHIPQCQICKSQYSASLVVGSKKICPKLFFQKIVALPSKQILSSIFYLIGVLLATYFIVAMSIQIFCGYNLADFSQIVKNFVFPGAFLYAGYKHAEKRWFIAEQSVVQVVQLTLRPNIAIK